MQILMISGGIGIKWSGLDGKQKMDVRFMPLRIVKIY